MSNPLRGEATIRIGGVDYRLVMDVNAFCFAQEVLDKKPLEIAQTISVDAEDLVTIRGTFWAGLQKHHPCHLIEAGELMSDAGQPEVRETLLKCLANAFGLKSADDKTEGKDGENPPKTPGTGSGSIGSTAKRAATAKPSGKKHRG